MSAELLMDGADTYVSLAEVAAVPQSEAMEAESVLSLSISLTLRFHC